MKHCLLIPVSLNDIVTRVDLVAMSGGRRLSEFIFLHSTIRLEQPQPRESTAHTTSLLHPQTICVSATGFLTAAVVVF